MWQTTSWESMGQARSPYHGCNWDPCFLHFPLQRRSSAVHHLLKNVLQLLYIIAHEISTSNSVSEYTHGPWKVSGACSLLMSCITEQESPKSIPGFLIGMNGNSIF